jgi:hypothetical protein
MLTLMCDNDASCVVDATMAENAQVVCRNTSACDIDCSNATTCHVGCFNTSECIVRCAGSGDCQISTCDPGGMMTCPGPGQIMVCGTDCP